jgi:lipopolysaccharide transport system permease protein
MTKLATSPPIPSPHRIVIEPARGWSALGLRDMWEYRDLLYFMVWRDIKARYRQTALGPLWIILQPLLSMALYTIVFGVIAKLPSAGQPYAVFAYVALLPWGFFSDAISSGTNSLLGNVNLISKVYFPRLIMPLASIVSSLVDFAISFVILLGLLAYFRITPGWGILLIPLFLLLAAITGLGVGLWFSGVVVRFRDFGQVAGYMVRLWMYATPVVYSIEVIPAQWRTLFRLNPLTGIMDGFRWALLGTPPPDWTLLALGSAVAVLVLIAGLFIFRRAERTIIDIA